MLLFHSAALLAQAQLPLNISYFVLLHVLLIYWSLSLFSTLQNNRNKLFLLSHRYPVGALVNDVTQLGGGGGGHTFVTQSIKA